MLKSFKEKMEQIGFGAEYPSVKSLSCPEHIEPVVDGVLLGGDNAEANNKLALIINEMCKSESGRSVIETAVQNGFTFVFDATEDAYGYADPGEMVCALNPNYSVPELITTIAHELRHIQQFEQPIVDRCSPYYADAQSNIAMTRVMEADAEAYGCLVSWELKELGVDGPWKTFSADFPEIAKPFEKALSENEGNPGAMAMARTAAFMGWYENIDRREYYDATYTDELDRMKPRMMPKHLRHYETEKMIAALCQDNGTSYFKADAKALNEPKYAAVSNQTKTKLEKFFGEYARQRPYEKNASVDHIPSFPYGRDVDGNDNSARKPAIAKSLTAKKTLMGIRQEQAAKHIKGRREMAQQSAVIRSKMLNKGR